MQQEILNQVVATTRAHLVEISLEDERLQNQMERHKTLQLVSTEERPSLRHQCLVVNLQNQDCFCPPSSTQKCQFNNT